MGNKPIEDFKNFKTLKDEPNSYFASEKKVRVHRNEYFVKHVQKRKYGWEEDMIECLNHVGEVKGVNLDQGIKIIFPDNTVWTFDRNALEAVEEVKNTKNGNKKPISVQLEKKDRPHKESHKYNKGDIVHLSPDEKKFIELQRDVGHYARNTMRGILGAYVVVQFISTHCVEVLWKGDLFSIHPDLIVEEDDKNDGASVTNEESVTQDLLEEPKHEYSCHVESVTQDLLEEPKHEYSCHVDLKQIFTAIREGKLEEVYSLLNDDLLNAKGCSGRTLISFTCCCGQLEIFKAFLEIGASMDICDDNGLYPIHICVVNNHNHILKCILINDKDAVMKLSMDGKSALHFAVIVKNKDAIKMLIEADINIFLMDDDEKSASQYTTDTEILNLIRPVSDLSVKQVPTVIDQRASLDLSRKNECDICKDQVKDVFFIPCGHASCSECSKQINKCHICKSRIENTNVLNL